MTTLATATARTLAGRIGGLSLAAQRDPREYTAPARKAFLASFLDQVDPDRSLPEQERLRRAAAARKLHFTRLALKSVRARQTKAGRRNGGAK